MMSLLRLGDDQQDNRQQDHNNEKERVIIDGGLCEGLILRVVGKGTLDRLRP